MGYYFECFADRSDVESNFEVTLGDTVEILYAIYDTPPWEGYAFVLFQDDGKLYEVNGSHCSCHGLEDQWEPEETTVAAIRHRAKYGDIAGCTGEAKRTLMEVLSDLETEVTPDDI